MITVVCSKCQAQFNTQDAHAGRVAPCPRCGNSLTIPAGVVPGAITVVVDGGGQAGAAPAIGHGGLAIAGFICGLLGFLLSLFLVIPCLGCWLLPVEVPLTLIGLILSIIALATARSANRKRGLAAAGLILSILAVIWAPLAFFLFLGGLTALGLAGAAATSGLPGTPFLPAAAPTASRPAGVPTLPSPFAPGPGSTPDAAPDLPRAVDTPVYRGTAFLVSPEGHLLTSGHVLRGAARASVQIGFNRYDAEILGVDETSDLGLLKIKASALPNLPLAEGAAPEPNAPVTAFGFPMAVVDHRQLQARRGTVLGRESQTPAALHLDIPLNPGFSGGPVIDRYGNVAGVVNAKAAGPGLGAGSYAVPIASAVPWLRSKGVSHATGSQGANLDAAILGKRVEPAMAAVSVVRARADSAGWNPLRPKLVWQQALGAQPRAAAVSPDGKLIAVACDAATGGGAPPVLQLRNAADGNPTRTLPGHQSVIWALAFSPDSATLASASGDGTVILWDTQKGQMRKVLKGHGGEVGKVAYSPDGKLLATVVTTGEVRGLARVIPIWDAETGEQLRTIRPTFTPSHMAFRPGGNVLVVGNILPAAGAGAMEAWDAETGQRAGGLSPAPADPKPVGKAPPGARAGLAQYSIATFAASPDGSWLAVALLVQSMGYRVDIVDYASLQVVRSLGDHYALASVAVSPDSRLVAVGYGTGLIGDAVAIYDVPSGVLVWDLPGNGRSVTFMPDGTKILRFGGVGHTMEVWDIAFLSRMGQPPPKLVARGPAAGTESGEGPPSNVASVDTSPKPEPRPGPKPGLPFGMAPEKPDAKSPPDRPQPQPTLVATVQQLDRALADAGNQRVMWVQLTRQDVDDQRLDQLHAWVKKGGVLWADTDLVRTDPADKSGFGFRLAKAPPDRIRGMASRPPREGAWVPGGQPGGATVPGAKKGRKPVAPPGAGIGAAGDQVEYILAEPAFMVNILLQKGGQLPRGYAVLLGWPAERGKTTVQAVCAARVFGRGVVVFRPREIGAAGGGPAFEQDLRDLSFQKARAGLGEPADTDPQQGESADTAPKQGESAIKAAARAFLTAVRDGDVDAAAAAALANDDQKKGLEIFVAAVGAQSKLQAAATARFGAEAKDLLTRSAIPSAQVLNDLIKNLDSTEAKEEGDTASIPLVERGPGLKMRKAGSEWKVDLGAAEGIVWPAAMRGQLEKAIKFVDQLTADVKAGKYKSLAEVGAAMRKGG